MPGQQAYIYQKNNVLPDAAIDFAVSPSAKTPLIYPVAKQGTGNLRVQGSFEGLTDALIDMVIADTAFTDPIVSAPIFKGAGTAKIKNIAASGIDAQKITVLCLSTGVSTQRAEIEIEGVPFEAVPDGAAGNAITIAIDSSPLVFTATDYSLLKALKVGDTALEGQEWDWDTKTILGEIIPDAAHRVAFAADRLHVYRQYKKWEDGKYRYYFIQPIKYEVKAGSRVYFVTEGRTVTVTYGETSEVYEDIVTIADLWAAVKALPSALIRPKRSSIDTSKTASSPAVREMAVMTDAYFLPPYKSDNSSQYAGELTGVITDDGTKTELIQAECIGNDIIGREKWRIKGSSSGDLGEGLTGDANDYGPVAFTIPQKFPPDFGNLKEDWSYEVSYAARVGVDPPPICLAMKLGINAREQTLTLTYKEKPAACACPPVNFNKFYLGLEEEGGEIGMAYTVEDLVFWTDVVAERMKEKYAENETYEGRDVVPGPGPENTTAWYKFNNSTAEYFRRIKTLASRIMALPEDDTEDLTAMVTDYKALVNSLTLYVGAGWITWDGAAWSSEPEQPNAIYDVSYDTDAYQGLVDDVLLYEKTYGLKKNSINYGDVPYTEVDSAFYWEVKGDKPYLPAYTDSEYYSVIRQGDIYINTKEFALHISVPCGGSLVEGDKIVVRIGGISYARTYQIGDITYLPTVAAADLHLAGGIDGDDTYRFGVQGEIDTFPDYLLDRDAPQAYKGTNAAAWQANHSYLAGTFCKNTGAFNGVRQECTTPGQSGATEPAAWATTPGQTTIDNEVTWTCRAVELQLEIEDGIIMLAVGDLFEFNIEGGHFKWRKDGGAWSSAIALSTAFQEITDGVEVAFEFGVSPSFMVDDAWEIICLQENRAANMVSPRKQAARGTGTITFSLDSPATVDCLLVDRHTLPAAITFQASNRADFATLEYEETITVTDFICKLYPGANAITAQYFRIVPGAVEAEIGHIFIGTVMQLSLSADSIKPLRRFYMSRQSGENAIGLLKYKKRGFDVGYKSYIRNPDWAKLDEVIDYLKSNNELPFYFIANTDYPADCLREASIYMDSVNPDSPIDHNAPEGARLYAISFNIIGV